MDETSSVELITALQAVWRAIQARHPRVPNVVLLPAPAPRGPGGSRILGHFAPLRWQVRRTDDQLLHEVVVVAEHLNRGAEDVVETLVHEAAHAMNFALGKRDCSRNQYHNRLFKAAAEELGLVVNQVQHYGFALTRMPYETADRYAKEIARLDSVLIHRRSFRPTTSPDPTTDPSSPTEGQSKTRSRKATCACPYIIRVSRKTLTDTTIRCDSCGQPFTLE